MAWFTRFFCGCCLIFCYLLPAWAGDSFTVQAIQIEGLQRIERSTVLNYLPVHVGEVLSTEKSQTVLHALYATGFFDDVSLAHEGNTLLVNVKERPVIASLSVSGNKDIPKDKLLEVLKNLGLVEGQALDPSVLERAKKGLQSEYLSRGKYNAVITATVTPMPRNRVGVSLVISEGEVVKITEIQINGNHVFSTKTLKKALSIATPNLFSYFTHDDQYSKERLDQAEEEIRNYYLDRGYIRVKILGTQALLTPDRRAVRIVINLEEGERYTVAGHRWVGNLILTSEKLDSLLQIPTGSVFSRLAIVDASKAIGRALGNQGYAFSNVNVVPEINDQKHEVFLSFYITPGHRVYVRRIEFVGNTKTEDEVLRREMRQMEGGLISIDAIEESKRRLNLLGYMENIDVQTKPVYDAEDQIDLDYHVTEGPSAQATASVGYGTDGFVFGAGINQSNFLGTGKSLGINLNTSTFAKNYSISYNDPYYTDNGIARGFNFFVQKNTPDNNNTNIGPYSTNIYGGAVNYSIPLFLADDSFQVGIGYQSTVLTLGNNPSSQMIDFVNRHGRHFNQLLLTSGWTHNGLDRAVFPTAGHKESFGIQLSLPGGGTALDYYKTTFDALWYHSLPYGFVTALRGAVGYGNSYGDNEKMPFFENYYAGGIGYIGAVRGYQTYSLGPQDSQNNPYGGNVFAVGSASMIFPNFISPDKLRTRLFVDAGNVYNTESISNLNRGSGPVRFSAGIAAELRLGMMGVINFSLAEPLNKQPGDSPEPFQFTIGTSF